MTTDTKAVERWEFVGASVRSASARKDGDYVLFTDHERIVEAIGLLWARELVKSDDALAASRAEVERLKKLFGETTQCLADVSNDVGGWIVEEVVESAMNAALEKGNV